MKTRTVLVLSFFLAAASFFGGWLEAKSQDQPPRPQTLRFPVKKFKVMVVTAYDPWDEECVGKWAEGNKRDPARRKKWSKPGIAADHRFLPLGTILWIPDIGYLTVDDTGGDMRDAADDGIYHIDIRMKSHAEAIRFGRRIVLVEILSPEKGVV